MICVKEEIVWLWREFGDPGDSESFGTLKSVLSWLQNCLICGFSHTFVQFFK